MVKYTMLSSGRQLYRVLPVLVLCSQSASSLASLCHSLGSWLLLINSALARHKPYSGLEGRRLGKWQDPLVCYVWVVAGWRRGQHRC